MASAPQPKIVLVTGANQGLGHAVIEVGGTRYPDNVYILGSRDLDKGKEAARKLEELGVKARVDVVQLDVTNDEHIEAAVRHVEKTYGRLDVLVNNAGFPGGRDLTEDAPAAKIRAVFGELLNVHITSVAVMTYAFLPLLRRAPAPRVINVTSGLGSMTRVLTPGLRMGRFPPYGASKVGMNGLTAHMQVVETERAAAEAAEEGKESRGARVRFFISNPGVLKTAFTHFHPMGRAPQLGAKSIVELIGDDEGKYDDHMQWEWDLEGDQMRKVPW